jgi:nucleotide-binding universal stress UspA family protein
MSGFSINKIVVPYDFSREAMNALDTALVIGQQQCATIVLLHVVGDGSTVFFGKRSNESVRSELTRFATENLSVLVKTLTPKYAFPIEYSVQIGLAAFEICRYVWENDCDIIVMGKGLKHRVGRIFRESVHSKIVRNCTCPVLLVPSDRLFTRFEKIVFPVRVAPRMLEKYDIVRPFVRQNNSAMVVAGLTGINNTENYNYVSHMVDEVCDKLRMEGVSFTARINFCDSISAQLLEISKGEGADMIVISSLGGSYLRSFFLEYYTRMVTENACCPVLSVRPETIPTNYN